MRWMVDQYLYVIGTGQSKYCFQPPSFVFMNSAGMLIHQNQWCTVATFTNWFLCILLMKDGTSPNSNSGFAGDGYYPPVMNSTSS
ncbi:hypothetical protein TNCT_11331 [Trichonephila clavata]|uniref:Uncharacterized protein n=1 Tax=Trichonephila clavata TaxID=2740835 RepID=A0A8X6GTI3_TRICU|nr:hypothetical protein TNCT_11331 [Trichonephila clavata]